MNFVNIEQAKSGNLIFKYPHEPCLWSCLSLEELPSINKPFLVASGSLIIASKAGLSDNHLFALHNQAAKRLTVPPPSVAEWGYHTFLASIVMNLVLVCKKFELKAIYCPEDHSFLDSSTHSFSYWRVVGCCRVSTFRRRAVRFSQVKAGAPGLPLSLVSSKILSKPKKKEF